MPMKRRLSKINSDRITPSVLANFARALELRKLAEQGAADPEDVHAAERIVDRSLGVRLWEVSIFDVYTFHDDGRSLQLRQQLDAALAEAKRAAATEPTAA
jgi:hypothetical protein